MYTLEANKLYGAFLDLSEKSNPVLWDAPIALVPVSVQTVF